MNKLQLLGNFICVILAQICIACGYTIVRDLTEEARQAELAAIDSLTYAPDLTISHIEYMYIPAPPRTSSLDRMVHPSSIRFQLTITNIGNAVFCKPYLITYTKEAPWPADCTTDCYSNPSNTHGDTIRANGEQALELGNHWACPGAIYTFVIVTNPTIQHDAKGVYGYFTHTPFGRRPIPVTREFRYDNNTAAIAIPEFEELIKQRQQWIQGRSP
jgi:hypothetical protein